MTKPSLVKMGESLQVTISIWLHNTLSKTIMSNAISSKGPFCRLTISSKRHFA